MRRLEGKVAIVAGGGGIGGATARRLASEGAMVALGDISLASAEATAAEIAAAGGDCIALAYDQAQEHSIAALVANAAQHFGRVDFMHANAADPESIRLDGDVLTTEVEIFDRSIAINMRGYFLLTREALPHLLENRGAIVYTSSGAAHLGETVRVAYGMAKAGVNALARHVASRWGKDGVRANAVMPGLVVTPKVEAAFSAEHKAAVLAGHRSPRLGEPDDIAAMVAMLFSKDGEWINGQSISVDAGYSMRP
jgi:NAD(P)-dependent dehydrogenase (short-subunit alcohol dehydrogenase family)